MEDHVETVKQQQTDSADVQKAVLGLMIRDDDEDAGSDANAALVVNAGIGEDWFEDETLGQAFAVCRKSFKQNETRISASALKAVIFGLIANGTHPDSQIAWNDTVNGAVGYALARKVVAQQAIDAMLAVKPTVGKMGKQAAESAEPDWPADAFVPTARLMAEQVAEQAQVPLDLSGAWGLGVMAGCCCMSGSSLEWAGTSEPLSLYVVVGSAPSDHKSTVLRAMSQAIIRKEEDDRKAWRPEKARWDARKKQLKALFDEAIKKKNNADSLSLSLEMLEHDEREPREPRMLMEDVTAERLDQIMSEQGRQMLMSADSGLMANVSARYSQGEVGVAQLKPYLNYWGGDPTRVDRMTRSTSSDGAVLSVCVMSQPEVVASLGEVAGARITGLLSRFLYCLPRSLVGHRRSGTKAPDEGTKRKWDGLLARLMSSKRSLRLSAEAYALSNRFQDGLEARMRKDGDLRELSEWIGKMQKGQLCRVAGILHCCETLCGDEVSAETMTRAIAVCNYFIYHAKKTFASMCGKQLKVLAEMATWLNDNKKPGDKFPMRDVYKALHKTKEEVEGPMDMLCDMGAVKQDGKRFALVDASLGILSEPIRQEEKTSYLPAADPSEGSPADAPGTPCEEPPSNDAQPSGFQAQVAEEFE